MTAATPGASTNRLEVSVRCASSIEWLDPMQSLAEHVFSMAGFDEEQAYWPVLAVREAVMNAVLHGNRELPELRIEISYVVEAGRLEVQVRDEGDGFDPATLGDPLSSENLLSEGGRGVYLMRQFMDEVRFTFPESGGTCISLVKRVPDSASATG